jgi:hypothetical protein
MFVWIVAYSREIVFRSVSAYWSCCAIAARVRSALMRLASDSSAAPVTPQAEARVATSTAARIAG